jgi:hypothetical protein
LDGDQPVVFYYIDPCYAMERHAGKAKFKNKFYFQYECEDHNSWTRPGVREFGRVNGGTAFQGFQIRAGNAVPMCHVFFADKAGSTKNSTHHPIYGELSISSLLKPTKTKLLSLPKLLSLLSSLSSLRFLCHYTKSWYGFRLPPQYP